MIIIPIIVMLTNSNQNRAENLADIRTRFQLLATNTQTQLILTL
jgi:hypothetical protein